MEPNLATFVRRSHSQSALRSASRGLIVQELIPLLNRLPSDFFSEDATGRMRMLDVLVEEGALRRLAKAWFASGTYASLSSGLYGFARELGICPLVMVQSAASVGEKQREEFQQNLKERYPGACILFQTVPDIGGGIRIFANGELLENTWHGRLRTLISRMNEHTYV